MFTDQQSCSMIPRYLNELKVYLNELDTVLNHHVHNKHDLSQFQLQVTSIRSIKNNYKAEPQTVGPTEIIDFSHEKIPTRIILNTTMTNAGLVLRRNEFRLKF